MATCFGLWGGNGVYSFFAVIIVQPSCLFDLVTWVKVARIAIVLAIGFFAFRGSRVLANFGFVAIPIFLLWIFQSDSRVPRPPAPATEKHTGLSR